MGHYYDGCCCSSFLFPLLLILILANITASAPSNTRTTDSSIRGPSSSSSSPSSLLHSESQERNSLDSTILKCPEEHSRYYCVNGGKCFIVNTGVSYEYSCECASGFQGHRCEYKKVFISESAELDYVEGSD